MTYRTALGVSQERYEALCEHLSERRFDGITYRHLPDYFSEFDRGVVLVAGGVVPGFPKIPRTLVLGEGIERHFGATDDDEGPAAPEVVVEEKLNGYNVRVARVEGRTLAFTRSGIVCPFTTHFAREWVPADCFDEHPDVVVCGEVVGPENPYTTDDYPEVDSIAFRAFDVRRRPGGDPLSVAERGAICDQYGIAQVPHVGRYDLGTAVEELPTEVAALDERGREGIVLKSPDGRRLLKYTTGAGNRDDLRYAFSLPFDRGQSFMFRRLLREAFQSFERSEDDTAVDSRARDLGRSILEPMRETVDRVAAGETVGEVHTVRAPPPVVDDLLGHLDDLGLHLTVLSDERRGDLRLLTFRKDARSTTDSVAHYLEGHPVRE